MHDAPLTAEECAEAQERLRRYLAEVYRSGEPFRLPTFRELRLTFAPGEVPRSAAVGRRGKGGHSDPTAAEALVNIEGIEVTVPEVVSVPAATITQLLAALPNHLGRPLQLAIIAPGGTIVGATDRLRLGRNAVADRCDGALRWLCAHLYGERWPLAEAS